MDTATTEITTAIVTAVAAIIGAIIAGSFTVRAAQIEAAKGGNSVTQPKISWIKLIILTLILGVFAVPISFIIAYIGNALSGAPSERLFGDALDSAINGGLLFSVGFILGTIFLRPEISWGKLLGLALIVTIFSAPTGFALAFFGNLLTGVPPEYLFGDSFDSGIMGGIFCGIGFILGAKLLKASIVLHH